MSRHTPKYEVSRQATKLFVQLLSIIGGDASYTFGRPFIGAQSLSVEPLLPNLEALDRRFRPALMAFFSRRLGSRVDAEDLTQEVFVRLASGQANQLDHADAYVFQIAANLLRDRGRRLAVRANNADLLRSVEQERNASYDGERILLAKENLQHVLQSLNELPTKTRDIFLLSRLERIPHAQLADMYAISVSAIQQHIVKATKHLATRVGERP